MLDVKILSLGEPERYAVLRMVIAAQCELQAQHDLQVSITEVGDPSEIGKYASVLVLPSPVINEKVVCSGCFPSKEAVIAWLREAMESNR